MKPTRLISPPGTYFVNTTTWARRALFQAEPLARIFFKNLLQHRSAGRYLLHDFVLMPNHCHIIFTPSPTVTLERAMQLIKGGSSHRLKAEQVFQGNVWQRGYTDHRIRDWDDYITHREYILKNAKQQMRGLPAEKYPFCSVYPGWTLDPVSLSG